jgi:hypothetical protein
MLDVKRPEIAGFADALRVNLPVSRNGCGQISCTLAGNTMSRISG